VSVACRHAAAGQRLTYVPQWMSMDAAEYVDEYQTLSGLSTSWCIFTNRLDIDRNPVSN
jgi:hypothetical protein